jgi:hypothetical protein
MGNISLGWALVAGRKRVPSPAAGKTAFRTLAGIFFSLVPAGLRWQLYAPVRNRKNTGGKTDGATQFFAEWAS